MSGIFALTNHKGGVGKSTSATTLALGLVGVLRNAGAKNNRVLLIDTDSQGHATLVTTGRNNFDTKDSLSTVLIAERQAASQVLSNCIIPSVLKRANGITGRIGCCEILSKAMKAMAWWIVPSSLRKYPLFSASQRDYRPQRSYRDCNGTTSSAASADRAWL